MGMAVTQQYHLPETSQEVNEKMEEIIFFIQQLMPDQSQ
jgi:hypothetical protein